jgi:hypothetical protein
MLEELPQEQVSLGARLSTCSLLSIHGMELSTDRCSMDPISFLQPVLYAIARPCISIIPTLTFIAGRLPHHLKLKSSNHYPATKLTSRMLSSKLLSQLWKSYHRITSQSTHNGRRAWTHQRAATVLRIVVDVYYLQYRRACLARDINPGRGPRTPRLDYY